jgi:hypothetical protein
MKQAKKDDSLVIRGLSGFFTETPQGDVEAAPAVKLDVYSPAHDRRFTVVVAEGAGEVVEFISEDGCRMNDSGELGEGSIGGALVSALGRIDCYLRMPKGHYSDEWKKAHREPEKETA